MIDPGIRGERVVSSDDATLEISVKAPTRVFLPLTFVVGLLSLILFLLLEIRQRGVSILPKEFSAWFETLPAHVWLLAVFCLILTGRVMGFVFQFHFLKSSESLLRQLYKGARLFQRSILERGITSLSGGIVNSTVTEAGVRLVLACLMLLAGNHLLSFEPYYEVRFFTLFAALTKNVTAAVLLVQALLNINKAIRLFVAGPSITLTIPRMPAFTRESHLEICHLSDLHLTRADHIPLIESAKEPSPNADFRVLIEKNSAKLSKSNVILITGDITDTGQPAEWAAFWKVMEPFHDKMILVPGNHDVNLYPYRREQRFIYSEAPPFQARTMRRRSMLQATSKAQGEIAMVYDSDGTIQTLNSIYARGGLLDASEGKVQEMWELSYPHFVHYSSQNVLVVVLDSIGLSTNLASNAFGFVRQSQLDKLERILSDFSGHSLVVGLHHHVALPLVPTMTVRGLTEGFKKRFMVLQNSASLLRVVNSTHPNAIFFHGHHHVPFFGGLSPKHLIVSAPSSSMGNSRKHGRSQYFYSYEVLSNTSGELAIGTVRRH